MPKLHDSAHGKHTALKPKCMADLAARFAKLYLAIELLAEDCGLTDIVPKVSGVRFPGGGGI